MDNPENAYQNAVNEYRRIRIAGGEQDKPDRKSFYTPEEYKQWELKQAYENYSDALHAWGASKDAIEQEMEQIFNGYIPSKCF